MYEKKYSIWLVPLDWKKIKQEFSLDFIPHITLSTNMDYISPNVLSDRIYTVKNFEQGQVYTNIDGTKYQYAYGYPCEIEGIDTLDNMYMTLYYASNRMDFLDMFSIMKTPPKDFKCKLYIADTTYLNPVSWKIIY